MHNYTTLEIKELQKIAKAVSELIPPRLDTDKKTIFQFKDAVDAGIVSRYEARRTLEFLQLPFGFPCFQ